MIVKGSFGRGAAACDDNVSVALSIAEGTVIYYGSTAGRTVQKLLSLRVSLAKDYCSLDVFAGGADLSDKSKEFSSKFNS